MHPYALTIAALAAVTVTGWLAYEYTEHRKRKAEARKAAAAEAMMARAIERGFIAAAQRRAADRLQAQQMAQHRAQLAEIEAHYWNRTR